MTKYVLILLMMAWAGPAGAGVKMTMKQAEESLGALTALSSGQDIVINGPDGKANRTVKQNYKGWSLATILAMTKDIQMLTNVVRPFDEAKAQRARSVAAPDGTIPQDKLLQLTKELDAEMNQPMTEMDLQILKVSDLKVEENNIPPAVLSQIGMLLDMTK